MKGSLGIGQGGLLRTQPDKQREGFVLTAVTTEQLRRLGGKTKQDSSAVTVEPSDITSCSDQFGIEAETVMRVMREAGGESRDTL